MDSPVNEASFINKSPETKTQSHGIIILFSIAITSPGTNSSLSNFLN